jgi:hypothetical protein
MLGGLTGQVQAGLDLQQNNGKQGHAGSHNVSPGQIILIITNTRNKKEKQRQEMATSGLRRHLYKLKCKVLICQQLKGKNNKISAVG